jgi:serine/threonine protein kinase
MEPLKSHDPKSIGPWKLIGRLGSGGMGNVYLAEKNIQRVALKVVQNFMDTPEIKARLNREVEVMRRIKSLRVSKVIDFDVNSDFAWIATEFIDGPDLKSYIETRGILNEFDWAGLAIGLFQGLREVHDGGVIHRDIKPSNIIISNSGPKLIDFGIAQGSDATSLTSTGSVAGSPAWLSPEQIHGEELFFSTDIFSAGSVLKFAATGISPWGDITKTSTPVIFNRIISNEPDFKGLTDFQKTFLAKLMHKDSKQRINASNATIELDKYFARQTIESINKTDNNASKSPSSSLNNYRKFKYEPSLKSTKRTKFLAVSLLVLVLIGAFSIASKSISPFGIAFKKKSNETIVAQPDPFSSRNLQPEIEDNSNKKVIELPSPEPTISKKSEIQKSQMENNTKNENLEWFTRVCRTINGSSEQCWNRKLTQNTANSSTFFTTGITQSQPFEFEMKYMPCMSLAGRYPGVINYLKSGVVVATGSVHYQFHVDFVAAFWEQHSRGECVLPNGNMGKYIQLPGLEGFKSGKIDGKIFDTVNYTISGVGLDFIITDKYSS